VALWQIVVFPGSGLSIDHLKMVPRVLVSAAVVAMHLASTWQVQASEAVFHRDFNGPEPTWQLLEEEVPAEILAQERILNGARDNAGSERLVVVAPAGHSAKLICPTDRIAVLDELQVRLWVKAPRPDLQLAVRVVLPRSRDATGRAATVLVRGQAYTRHGQWQQLMLAELPRRLRGQVRLLRATNGAKLDDRQAYVDAVVLVVPGEPNGLEIFTDELEVDGVLQPSIDEIQLASYEGAADTGIAEQSEVGQQTGNISSSDSQQVRLHGGIFLVNGRPLLPRGITWQGEPLSFLADCGFNVILLRKPPTADQAAEAKRRGLWFLCVPPPPDVLLREKLGRTDDRVLAWYLQHDAVVTDPQYAQRWGELIRQQDVVAGRPVMIAVETDWAKSSKAAEILLARHPRFGILPSSDYEQWLDSGPRRVGGGSVWWVAVPTQFGEQVAQQLSALVGTESPPPNIEGNQLDALVRIACTRCARGFVFESRSPLNQPDTDSRLRAAVLERINRQLQLMEPWLASGKSVGRLASSDAAWSSMVLQADRARLLIPVCRPASLQTDVSSGFRSTWSGSSVSYVVPGIPESSQAFLLSPVALRTLAKHRVAGGMRLVVPTLESSFVLITEDPQVIQHLRQQIMREGPTYVRSQRNLAAQRSIRFAETARRLAQLGYASETMRVAATVNAQLPEIDRLLTTRQTEQANNLAEALLRELDRAAFEQRRAAAINTPYYSNPLALGNERLADCVVLERSLDYNQSSENLLYGGDFEDIAQMTDFGWRHYRYPLPGIDSRVLLASNDAQQGGYCLEMQTSASSDQSDMDLPSAPVWIVSPPVNVEPGQRIEIIGWVRVDQPIHGGGLQIIDTLGGPELSLAIRQTTGWQPFRMVRAVRQPEQLRITFALTGLGTVRLDAVTVRAVWPTLAHRLPPPAEVNK
jgi:hypothetical protein